MSVLIVTAGQEIYRGRASFVTAPSMAGDIGIMPGHAPLLARLKPGEMRIECPDNQQGTECHTDHMVVFGGFLEVQPDGITILADAIERAADIDEAQASRAIKQAKRMLTSPDKDKASQAMLELELAIAQLRVVHSASKQSFMKI